VQYSYYSECQDLKYVVVRLLGSAGCGGGCGFGWNLFSAGGVDFAVRFASAAMGTLL
jgi:hypothetical protein